MFGNYQNWYQHCYCRRKHWGCATPLRAAMKTSGCFTAASISSIHIQVTAHELQYSCGASQRRHQIIWRFSLTNSYRPQQQVPRFHMMRLSGARDKANIKMLPATATFSDSMFPSIGTLTVRHTSSAVCDNPCPSEPSTKHTAWLTGAAAAFD